MRRTQNAIAIVLAALAASPTIATPAAAQFFDRIFRDEPPRPPADVRRDLPPPPGFERQQRPPADAQRPTFQTLRPPAPPQQAPGEWQNPDLLPQNQRTPAAVSPDGVQSQPLAPPPGAEPDGQERLRGPQDAALPPGSQPGQAQPPADLPPADVVVVQPPEQKIVNPTAVFSGLDKITGRTITFDVAINETVQFGALQVTPRACYSRPPTETQNTDAFIKVDEVTLQGNVKQIFSGWVFAASPGLNAIEHPIYDIWLVDCKGGAVATAEADTGGDRASAPPPQQRQPRRPAARPQQPGQPGFLPALR